jgi:fatty-acyl-CoA synthase
VTSSSASTEPAGADYLWSRLLGDDQPLTRSLVAWTDGRYVPMPWSDVVRGARRMTGGLRRRGVRPGARVASVLTNTPDVVQGVLAVWLTGAALASLPMPSRGVELEEYLASIATMCDQIEPELCVLDAALLPLMPSWLTDRFPFCSWQELHDSSPQTASPDAPPGDGELAYIQYSSGSSSVPKGCMLTADAIAAQVAMVADWTQLRRGGEVIGSWLPLSHDMGMFGTLISAWRSDSDLYMSTPERFGMSPRSWFADIAEFGVTVTAGTNTGLRMSTRGFRRHPLPDRRIRMRVCIIGAERVEWEAIQDAVEVFGPIGLTTQMFMPAYGLAEATLAVTATGVEEEPRRVTLDAVDLARGVLTQAPPDRHSTTSIVSAGRPLSQVRLGGLDGTGLAQVRIVSPSLASGYWRAPELSSEHFTDGALVTNDLGFMVDGHLYLVGRNDDMINIAGRNVYARAVEQAIEDLDGVRRGCSTLIAHHNGDAELLTLLAETYDETSNHEEIARSAATIAMSKAAMSLDECVFLRRGSLPKTPSGKIQRWRCRELFGDGRLDVSATVDLASVTS